MFVLLGFGIMTQFSWLFIGCVPLSTSPFLDLSLMLCCAPHLTHLNSLVSGIFNRTHCLKTKKFHFVYFMFFVIVLPQKKTVFTLKIGKKKKETGQTECKQNVDAK